MNRSTSKKWFLLLPIILIFSSLAEAQVIKGKTNRVVAEQAILLLKDGALVVRLKSKRNKITKLEELLSNPEVNESDKKKLEKDLKNTIEERDNFNSALFTAFNEYYTFSAFYFMYDTASVALKNGEKSGFLLDNNLKVDPEITITQDSFFVIYKGTLDATNRTGLEALIIMDSRFNIVPSPFPYYTRVNNFWLVLGRFFSPKKAVKRDATKIVQELDGKLKEYYKLN